MKKMNLQNDSNKVIQSDDMKDMKERCKRLNRLTEYIDVIIYDYDNLSVCLSRSPVLFFL